MMPHTSEVGAILTSLVYLAGSMVCHQQAERSFHITGVQLAVCARCAGLYLGGAVGVLSWLAWRRLQPQLGLNRKRAVRALLIASAPTAITVASALAGVWDLSNVGRAILAVPMGLAAGVVLAAIASNDLS